MLPFVISLNLSAHMPVEKLAQKAIHRHWQMLKHSIVPPARIILADAKLRLLQIISEIMKFFFNRAQASFKPPKSLLVQAGAPQTHKSIPSVGKILDGLP